MRTPHRLFPRLAIPVVGVALLGGGWALSGPRPTARPEFQRAWWYWHHPFRLSADEVRDLRRANCVRLYVHAGTLVARVGRLELTSPQRFESAAPCDLYAVLRIHPGAHPLLLTPEGPARITKLVQAAKWPANVRGLQLDADIPTARLADYAHLLAGVRHQLPVGWTLSVTALPDWLGSRDYARVCDAVDEVAPQFYGNRWPVAGRKPPPLWETADWERLAGKATAGRARAWIGLPSYGRCVVLDPQGRPLGVRHDLDPEALLETTDWTTASPNAETASAQTEDSLTLRAATQAVAGSLMVEPGATLWFQWPRVEALQRAEQELAALRTPGVAGVCYFRWPAPREPLALRPQPHAEKQPAQPLTLAFQRSAEGTRLIVRNEGSDAPLLSKGAAVTLTGDLAGVESGAFGEYRLGDEPCSALRADRAVFSRTLLRPGSQWTVCRLSSKAGRIAARLTWQDGTSLSHTITAERTPETRTR
jgi:hypothetical protein